MTDAPPLFEGPEIAELFEQLAITHVIWIPDSTTGRWESALQANGTFRLLRVCREGEAWPLAAGLLLGGQRPIVIMQSTGLFESGDALRNILHDLRLPVFAIIGARNWITADSQDSAKRFLEPILRAWHMPYDVIENRGEQASLVNSYQVARREQRPGFVLLAEGRG